MDVELRPVTDADVEVFYEQQLDPEARRVAVFPLRDHDTFTTHWRERILANEANYAWTIVADGEVAGNMLCFERDGKREVGYWLGRASWGRGIATAALAALRREVTERPLYAYVARSNVGSIRVLEKCGFVEVGEQTGDDGIEELILELPLIPSQWR
jgi:RimJ/RimL family protein N-acetyltransferase